MGGGGVRYGMRWRDNGGVLRGNILGGGTVVVAGSETEQGGRCKVARDVNTTSIYYYFILSTEFYRF